MGQKLRRRSINRLGCRPGSATGGSGLLRWMVLPARATRSYYLEAGSCYLKDQEDLYMSQSMNRREETGLLRGALALVLLAFTPYAFAHHSFAATYHEDQEARIEGKIIQFLFRNPHSFVHVEAPDESGTMQQWVVEWRAATGLSNQGVGVSTLKVGDEVVITGNKARDPADHRLRMLSLTRKSDGFTWGMRSGEVVD